MTTADTQPQATETPKAPSLTDENISFTDYQVLRRGGTLPAKEADKSAPTPKEQEQNEPAKSDAAGKEAKSESDEGEPEADDSDEGEGKEAKTKKQAGGWQRRIDKKTREAADARREAEYWKTQALKGAAAEKPQSQEPAKPHQADAKDKPQPGTFETHVEYSEALARWTAKQELDAYKREQADLADKAKASSVERSFAERVKSFTEKNPDFHDVVADAREQNLFVSEAMHGAIMDSENGPALFYELAKNPAESVRIAQLTPSRQLMEMGKIESRITQAAVPSKETKPEQKTTQAPKPPTPVGTGKATATRSLDDPEIPFADYVRIRREQMKRRRG